MVADASFVVRALAADPVRVRGPLRAPHLIDLEVASAVRGLVRARTVSPDDALLMLRALRRLRIRRYPHGPLLAAGWRLRDVHSAYDAAYVALAQLLDEPLVTADRRLARAARRHVEVVLAE